MVEAVPAPKKVKLLITGNVNGETAKLYQLVDNIQSKKGNFDALLCVGKFLPPSDANEMREFKREVLDQGSQRKSIDTFFTDSSELIAPFMNSQSSRNGLTFG